MKQAVLLEVKLTDFGQTYQIQIDSQITFQQLHHTILILFQWKDDQPYQFQYDKQTISWNDKRIHDAITSTIEHKDDFLYYYGEGKQQRTISLHAIVTAATLGHHIEVLDHPWNTCKELAIRKELDAISVPKSSVSVSEFTALLEMLRDQLLQVKTIAPCLLLFEHCKETIPIYLDILDNGIELMIFPDEPCFVRSIVNASSPDPDLLFTYSYTFDFLYEPLKESELPLFADHTLCYKNMPGCLPCAFDDIEYYYAYTLLSKLHQLLSDTQYLPSFADHKLMRIQEDGNFILSDYDLPKSPSSLMLTSDDYHHMLKLPHTNEHYHMVLQAMPYAHSKHTHQLKISLCAVNQYFHKEMEVDMSSIETLSEDIYIFLKQLFRERGLAETIAFSSCNLYYLMEAICTELGIECKLRNQQSPCENELLDMICDMMAISQEELLHLEATKAQETKLWS